MPRARRQIQHRPRELRRRVVMPARLRSSVGWTDACILNISSRGLMIHSARTGPQGSKVELWRGETVIVARVVWQDGARSGLQTEEPVAVEHILSLNSSAEMTFTAVQADRRSRPRGDRRRRDRRSQGRMIEYVGVVAIACSLAASTFELIERALWRPLALIASALG